MFNHQCNSQQKTRISFKKNASLIIHAIDFGYHCYDAFFFYDALQRKIDYYSDLL